LLTTLEPDRSFRDVDEVAGLEDHVGVGFSLFQDLRDIDDECAVGAAWIFAGDLYVLFVGEIAEAAGAEDGFADGKGFVAGDVLGTGGANGADQVDLAAALGHDVYGDNNRRLEIVFLFELFFEFVGQLLAGFIFGGKSAEIRYLQIAGVSDEKLLGIFFI